MDFKKTVSSIRIPNSLIRLILGAMSDKQLIKLKFRWHMGYSLDLENPETLNEKINWLKLNDRTPLHTQCSDKFRVREYIKDKIGTEYLVPLYFHTKDPLEITSENLPETPCIIKTNNDSGGGFFIRDKSQQDWTEIQESLKNRMNFNYFLRSREWQYKNIQPRIIVEKLLQDKKGDIPFDYKVHCFNGRVRMISVDMGRGTENHYRNWYSIDWRREPYSWSSPKGHNKFTIPSDEDVEKPETLDEMINLSQILAEPFTYVRVDWYDLDGKLYFGEMTFHHDSGVAPILPAIWDKRLGSELTL